MIDRFIALESTSGSLVSTLEALTESIRLTNQQVKDLGVSTPEIKAQADALGATLQSIVSTLSSAGADVGTPTGLTALSEGSAQLTGSLLTLDATAVETGRLTEQVNASLAELAPTTEVLRRRFSELNEVDLGRIHRESQEFADAIPALIQRIHNIEPANDVSIAFIAVTDSAKNLETTQTRLVWFD